MYEPLVCEPALGTGVLAHSEVALTLSKSLSTRSLGVERSAKRVRDPGFKSWLMYDFFSGVCSFIHINV